MFINHIYHIINIRHVFIFGITFGFNNLISFFSLCEIQLDSHVITTKLFSSNTSENVRHSAVKSLYAEGFCSVLL